MKVLHITDPIDSVRSISSATTLIAPNSGAIKTNRRKTRKFNEAEDGLANRNFHVVHDTCAIKYGHNRFKLCKGDIKREFFRICKLNRMSVTSVQNNLPTGKGSWSCGGGWA